jgi:hypothetical protein
MAKFSAEGLIYSQACKLIDELKANNIDSNITVGGVSIYPNYGSEELARSICQKYGASFAPGCTRTVQNVLLQSESGVQSLIETTDDAISRLQEFE